MSLILALFAVIAVGIYCLWKFNEHRKLANRIADAKQRADNRASERDSEFRNIISEFTTTEVLRQSDWVGAR